MSESLENNSLGSPELERLIDQYLQLVDDDRPVDVDLICAEAPHLIDDLRSFIATDMVVGEIGETNAICAPHISLSSANYDTVMQEEKFGRYKLIKLLGQGAMGAVYLAEDSSLQRQVALKIPMFENDRKQEYLSRFLREARSAAAVSHPNICKILDIGEENKVPFITMDYINGKTLSSHIDGELFNDEIQIVKLMILLAKALDKAHSQGIIHRDLKPGNVMIDSEGTPFITDFGLARRIDQPDGSRLTQEGTILGTPAYMSPEQIEGNPKKIGPQSDLYSLGVMFYELLTGELPFKGTIPLMLGQILRDPPSPPSKLRKGLDKQLDLICLRMMEKSQEKRNASCADVAKELQTWLDNQQSDPKLASETKQLTTQKASEIELPHSYVLEGEQAILLPSNSILFGGVKKAVFMSGLALVVIVAVITFSLNPGGYMVDVTIDDPTVKIYIDDNYVKMNGTSGKVTLDDGEHEVIVKRNGIVLEAAFPSTYTVSKHGRNLLAIKVFDVANAAQPLNGKLNLIVSGPPGGIKKPTRIETEGALPVRDGERIHIDAKLTRPAYIYLVWIDSEGKLHSLYPWNEIDQRMESTVVSLQVHSPAQLDKGWEVVGVPGQEMIVLLARSKPLSKDEDIKLLVGGELPPLPVRDEQQARWLSVTQQGTAELMRSRTRAPLAAADLNDPALKWLERLRVHFELIEAIRFPHVAK